MIDTLIGLAEIVGVMVLVGALLIGVSILERRQADKKATLAAATAELEPVPSDTSAEVAGPSPELLAAVAIAVADYARDRRLQAAPHSRVHQPGSLLYASHWVAVGRGRQQQTWRR